MMISIKYTVNLFIIGEVPGEPCELLKTDKCVKLLDIFSIVHKYTSTPIGV